MQNMLIKILGSVAVLVGVQSKAKEIILLALKSGKIRQYVLSTDNKIDDAFLDFLAGVVEGQWDKIWNDVICVVKDKKGSRNKAASQLETAEAFSAALQKAVTKAQKKR